MTRWVFVKTDPYELKREVNLGGGRTSVSSLKVGSPIVCANCVALEVEWKTVDGKTTTINEKASIALNRDNVIELYKHLGKMLGIESDVKFI